MAPAHLSGNFLFMELLSNSIITTTINLMVGLRLPGVFPALSAALCAEAGSSGWLGCPGAGAFSGELAAAGSCFSGLTAAPA